MSRLSLVLPVPPSVNNAYATVDGRRVLRQACRAYKHEAGWHVRKAVVEQQWDAGPGARYALHLRIWFSDQTRRDLDNTLKLLQDALFGALHLDDQLIDELHVQRAGIDPERPRVELTLSVYEQVNA
jgi:crossover junction endodeoxyribonuclease RusA